MSVALHCQHAKGTRYTSGRQPVARVSSVARVTIFSGLLSELKYNNYDLIKIEFLI
jgi:hypothetical protein